LVLFARHLAWLDAVPDMGKGSERKTRHTLLKEHDSPLVQLPDVEDGFIVEWMNEVGWYQVGMSGLIPITWTELNAWATMTSTNVTPSESILMMNLSKAYVGQFNQSDDRNTPAPFTEVQISQEQLGNKLKAILRNQSANRPKK
jgi:hypothetical protein